MVEKTFHFPDIKSNWNVEYLMQTTSKSEYQAVLVYTVIDCEYTWNPSGNAISSGYIPCSGKNNTSDGYLLFKIMNSEAERLDNTWAESIITPNSNLLTPNSNLGTPILGRTYTLSFEDHIDNEGEIQYNKFILYILATP